MCLGCVVRVKSTGQDSTTSLGASLAGEVYLWWVLGSGIDSGEGE